MSNAVSISFLDLQPECVSATTREEAVRHREPHREPKLAWGPQGPRATTAASKRSLGTLCLVYPEPQVLLKPPFSSIGSPEFCGFLPALPFSSPRGTSISTLMKQHPSSHTEVSGFFFRTSVDNSESFYP